jgi:hypothetical protein
VSRPPSKRAHSVVRDPPSAVMKLLAEGSNNCPSARLSAFQPLQVKAAFPRPDLTGRQDTVRRTRPREERCANLMAGVNALDRSARNEFEGAALSVLQLGLTFKSRQPQRKRP